VISPEPPGSAVRAPGTDAVAETPAPGQRFGLELLAVLGVSYGMSGLTALLSFVRSQITINHGAGFAHVATGPINSGTKTAYPWLDILDQLVGILSGLMPAFLAIVLLMRSPAGPGLGIGLERLRARLLGPEALRGLGFAAVIGIPGLGLVYVARKLGLNAQIVVTDFPDVWYRIPVLILDAFQDGIGEEIVVCAFVLTRLRQLGWSNRRALITESALRGSYHLYQGYGGFGGNFVMGLIFGWWFQRTRRVLPLVVAHSVIDAISFIGYVYLHDRYPWI
jgi:membrane protease YdiL (CAAX protease family)